MLSQAPSSSLKLSRRSACDRCKEYKLKCIREGKASDPCQRCAKADLSCATTVVQAVDAASSRRNHEKRKISARQVHKVSQGDGDGQLGAGGEAKGHSGSRLLPRSLDPGPETQTATQYPRLLPRQNFAEQPHGVLLNGMGSLSNQFSMALETSTFPLVDPVLSHEDLDMLIGDHLRPPVHPEDSCMTLGFDEQALGTSTNSSFNESICTPNPSMDMNRTQQAAMPDAQHQPTEAVLTEPYDHHQALLDLQMELVHDQQILSRTAKLPHPPGHNPLKCSTAVQHHPVNRLLKHTARFWEVLKAMCKPTPGSTDKETRQLPSSTQDITHKDHILLVTMVTTYVTLLRSCRELFARFQAGFELALADPSVSFADASLPKLQFGELEVENNLELQVNILIELMSSMLLRIASALQVKSAASIGVNVGGSEYCLPFWSNDTAVLLRDTIIDEERAQMGDFCLGDLMQSVKDILKDQRINA